MNNVFEQENWEQYAESYDALTALRPYEALQGEVENALCLSERRSVLDVACGTGNYICRIQSSRGDHIDVSGIDFSRVMLERAKLKCAAGTKLITANLNEDLPIASGIFDGVFCVNTLYALGDPGHFLGELSRVLEYGGRLVLVTPKRQYENGLVLKAHCGSTKPDTYWEGVHSSPEREDLLIRESLGDSPVADAMRIVAFHNRLIGRSTKFHFFDQDDLLALVEKHGFCVLEHHMTYAKQCHFVVAVKRGNVS